MGILATEHRACVVKRGKFHLALPWENLGCHLDCTIHENEYPDLGVHTILDSYGIQNVNSKSEYSKLYLNKWELKMVIWSVQSDIFFRVLLLFCICCRWEGVGRGEYFTDDGCLIGLGGGEGEGLLKTWIFRSATHMERGDDFELFCMRPCQLFERWIALFTWWISIHWIAQSIFWTIGAWSIKDYLYGQKGTFSCGPTREVPNEQDEFILPAGVANQNTFFASSCPLMNSAI